MIGTLISRPHKTELHGQLLPRTRKMRALITAVTPQVKQLMVEQAPTITQPNPPSGGGEGSELSALLPSISIAVRFSDSFMIPYAMPLWTSAKTERVAHLSPKDVAQDPAFTIWSGQNNGDGLDKFLGMQLIISS